jgi:hypothetical protein
MVSREYVYVVALKIYGMEVDTAVLGQIDRRLLMHAMTYTLSTQQNCSVSIVLVDMVGPRVQHIV